MRLSIRVRVIIALNAFVLCLGGIIERWHLPSSLRGEDESGVPSGPKAATLKDLEATHIADAIRRHGGNRTAAARELGINPSTLFRRIKSHGIKVPERDGRHRTKA